MANWNSFIEDEDSKEKGASSGDDYPPGVKDDSVKKKYTMQNGDEKGKLFVGGLSWETTQEKLEEFFGQFGEVVDCVVMKNLETGRSRGFGFITFKVADNVEHVLNTGPHIIDGRTVDPKPCNPRTAQSRASRLSFPKIFLGGLPSNVTETSLRTFFAKYGKVTEVVIMYDQERKKTRGFGFLSFESDDSVERCVAERFVTINGKQVEVKKAEPRGDFRSGGGRGRGMQDSQNGQDASGWGNMAGMTPGGQQMMQTPGYPGWGTDGQQQQQYPGWNPQGWGAQAQAMGQMPTPMGGNQATPANWGYGAQGQWGYGQGYANWWGQGYPQQGQGYPQQGTAQNQPPPPTQPPPPPPSSGGAQNENFRQDGQGGQQGTQSKTTGQAGATSGYPPQYGAPQPGQYGANPQAYGANMMNPAPPGMYNPQQPYGQPGPGAMYGNMSTAGAGSGSQQQGQTPGGGSGPGPQRGSNYSQPQQQQSYHPYRRTN